MKRRGRKILFIGDAGVGKTSIINKKARITDETTPTLSVTCHQDIEVNGCLLALWDTAGQERYRSVTVTYFREAAGIILVCDWSRENAIASLDEWHTLIRERGVDAPLFVVISKVDLPHVVSEAEIQAHVAAWDPEIPVINVSSKTGEGIDLLFEIVAEKTQDPQETPLIIAEPEKKGCCQ